MEGTKPALCPSRELCFLPRVSEPWLLPLAGSPWGLLSADLSSAGQRNSFRKCLGRGESSLLPQRCFQHWRTWAGGRKGAGEPREGISHPPRDCSPLGGMKELQGSIKGVVRCLGFPFPCLVQTDAKNQPRRECSLKGFTRCPCQKQSVRIATKFSPYAPGSRDLELNSLSRKPPVFSNWEENTMCRLKMIFSTQHRNHLNLAVAAGD